MRIKLPCRPPRPTNAQEDDVETTANILELHLKNEAIKEEF